MIWVQVWCNWLWVPLVQVALGASCFGCKLVQVALGAISASCFGCKCHLCKLLWVQLILRGGCKLLRVPLVQVGCALFYELLL